MSNKVDILLGIQYRDKLSVGPNRVRLGQRAFHWSIIVVVDSQYHRFDVTDGVIIDPVTLQDINPDRLWVYRHNVSDSLLAIPRYLGSIQINQKSLDVSIDGLANLLDRVPMPSTQKDGIKDNNVSWTAAGIRTLQKAGWCQSFDLKDLEDFALQHADRRLANFRNKNDPMRFSTGVNRWLRLF